MQVNSAAPSAADATKNTTNIAGNSSADEMSTMFLELLVAQISNPNHRRCFGEYFVTTQP